MFYAGSTDYVYHPQCIRYVWQPPQNFYKKIKQINFFCMKHTKIIQPKHLSTHKFIHRNSYALCCKANPKQHYEMVIVPGYGDMDHLLGMNGNIDVYPYLSDFITKYATKQHSEATGILIHNANKVKLMEPKYAKPKMKRFFFFLLYYHPSNHFHKLHGFCIYFMDLG